MRRAARGRSLRLPLGTGPSLRPPRGLLGTGFTLIEIIIAVAVLATAMGAIITGMARYVDNAASLREKTVALWVAHNRLTELELDPGWPNTGKSDGDVEMAGAEWRWFLTVSETPDASVRRVDIRVQLKGTDSDAISLSSFLSSAGRT